MSTEDGPGIRTTVFFKMCPLRCVWCHNPESLFKKPSIQWFQVKCIGCRTCIDLCKQQALSLDEEGMHIDRDECIACGECVEACPGTALRMLGEYWSVEDLLNEVAKDRAYYVKSRGGITASGGEAAVQSDFVTEFFKRCKEDGFHTALDLSGYLPKEKYAQIFPYVDLWLYDLKEFDDIKHQKFTGVSNTQILENIKWLVKENRQIWVRTPIIPTYTASEKNIREIGNFIVNELDNKIDRWDLLAFNNLAKAKYARMDMEWACNDLDLLLPEEMEYFFEIAKSTGVKNVKWSGLTKTVETEDSQRKISKFAPPSCGVQKN
ncbi:MAG: glycyl-radical enzyme activating protein [Candidatus Lokiarchaeota archaeon]|nr:glycyl-radical enzyme activating protein [Candidatus Lokiarchaeota archaeon]